MPRLAFCANCGSERLDIIAGGRSIQIRCYVCTKTSDVSGVILGEVDFLAGAQAKVDAMIAKARERATGSLSESCDKATTQRAGTSQGSLRR